MSDTKNNTGEDNTGNRNSGYGNSGNGNSGNRNSGYGNSGNRNSGDRNSGYGNSGDRNSGYGNSGNRNSGNWNSGYGNSTNRSSGIFCNQEPKLIIFNEPTDKKWNEIDHPYFTRFELNKWISESEMTDEEKKENPNFFVSQGYLKTVSWEEAWKVYWEKSDKEEKDRVLNLPNFDAAVFKDITGIDVGAKNCEGKMVEVDGVKYKLVRA